MNQLKIEYVDLEQLKPFVDNPRNHSERNVDDILQSMKRFGWTNPIIARRDDNMVIAGHGRIEAARLNGTEQVPVIFTDFTENDAKLYSITDNRTSETSDWDLVALNDLVKELDEMPDIDLDDSGFTSEELDDLLADVSMDLDQYADKDADAVPDVQETAQTQTGDIWHLGPHRVLCGDATKEDDVERLMDGNKAIICFTSPPYNVGSLNIKGNKTTMPKYLNFDDSISDWFGFVKSVLTLMLKYSCEVFLNVGLVQKNKDDLMRIPLALDGSFKDIIYWVKDSCAPHIQPGVMNNRVEMIYCFGNNLRKFDHAQFSQGTYFNVIEGSHASLNVYADIHKSTFPVYLPENIISNFSPNKAIVVDCFCGTGTTLIASEKTGRQCYGMEIDPHYCDVIARRYVDFVGTHADAWLERDGQRTHYSEMFDVLPVQIPTTDGSAAVSETAL